MLAQCCFLKLTEFYATQFEINVIGVHLRALPTVCKNRLIDVWFCEVLL